MSLINKSARVSSRCSHRHHFSISDEGRGPLSVPTWYAYDAGGNLRIMTGRESQKGQLLARAGRFSRCVQTGNFAVQVRQRRGAVVSSETRISSAICAPSPVVIWEKKWATAMKRRETYLHIATTSLSACVRNDG
jgi:hypothetical protein